MADKTDEEIANEYSEAMADGDFVTEFQEGSNRTRFMVPRDLKDLMDARDKARARDSRRQKGIFKRVVD